WREVEGPRLLRAGGAVEGGAGPPRGAAPARPAGGAPGRGGPPRPPPAPPPGAAPTGGPAPRPAKRRARAPAQGRARGAAGGGSEGAGEDLRRALAEVQRALRVSPTDTGAWMAGYRVAQAESQVGAFENEVGTSGGASADSRSSIVGAQDPDRTPAVARASGSEGGVRGSSSAEDLARLFAEGAVRSDTYGGQSRR